MYQHRLDRWSMLNWIVTFQWEQPLWISIHLWISEPRDRCPEPRCDRTLNHERVQGIQNFARLHRPLIWRYSGVQILYLNNDQVKMATIFDGRSGGVIKMNVKSVLLPMLNRLFKSVTISWCTLARGGTIFYDPKYISHYWIDIYIYIYILRHPREKTVNRGEFYRRNHILQSRRHKATSTGRLHSLQRQGALQKIPLTLITMIFPSTTQPVVPVSEGGVSDTKAGHIHHLYFYSISAS